MRCKMRRPKETTMRYTRLNFIYKLSEAGEIEQAADRIFDLMRDYFEEDKFWRADRILKIVNIRLLGPELADILAAASYCAKDELPHREQFCADVMEIFDVGHPDDQYQDYSRYDKHGLGG